jgi:hypothetical protein
LLTTFSATASVGTVTVSTSWVLHTQH